MKSLILVILIFTGGALAADARGGVPVWHTSVGQDTLMTDSNWVLVKLEGEVSSSTARNWLTTEVRRIATAPQFYVMEGFMACSLSVSSSYSSFLDSLKDLPEVLMAEPYYRQRDGQPFVIGETFCVKFNPEVTKREIDIINQRYGVSVDYKFGGGNVFTLKNHPASGRHTLDLASEYHKLPEVIQAHPNFGTTLELHGYNLYDYYHEYCSHVKQIIGEFNSATVWDFAGVTKPIVVAVVDDGFGAHEDLPSSRILPGRDLYDHDSDPDPHSYRSHGANCAGLIAASHSTDTLAAFAPSSGIISVDPFASLLPIKIYPDGQVPEGVQYPMDLPGRAIDTAVSMGADVISCSWSYPPQYKYVDSLTIPMNQALENACNEGRSGLGTVVVFSAGNNGRYQLNYPSSDERVVCVGAIHLSGVRWDYSNYSLDPDWGTVDLMACSGYGEVEGVWTIDPMDTLGSNYYVGTQQCASSPTDDTAKPCDIYDCPSGNDNINYMCEFGGTSAAAPQVAGVASLVLSRDSTLTLNELKEILYNSAVPLTPSVPDFQYGWGRVDAYRAILSIARGDASNDDEISLLDVMYLVDHVFQSGPPPWPDSLLGDVTCDGAIALDDIMLLVDHLFVSYAPLPLPCFEFND